MNLRTPLLLSSVVMCSIFGAHAQDETTSNYNPAQFTEYRAPETAAVTYMERGRTLDPTFQQSLREKTIWQNFLQNNGDWWVSFDEATGLPSRAMGKPIAVTGADYKSMALNFIQNHLSDFVLPQSELVFEGVSSSSNHHWVRFHQEHDGMPIFGSEMVVKITNDNKVIMFGSTLHKSIPTLQDQIGSAQAENFATAGLNDVISSSDASGEMFIVPVPKKGHVEYHMAHKVMVHGTSEEQVPVRYFTLVDAYNGNVLYRANEVSECGAACGSSCEHQETADNIFELHQSYVQGTADLDDKPLDAKNELKKAGVIELDVEGALYTTHSYSPSTIEKLPNMNCTINGNTFITDANGFVSTTESGPAMATLELSGLWSTVDNNGTTPSFTTAVNDGTNVIDLSGNNLIQEISAYYHVNIIHDHMKVWFPSFTGMDFSLPTNVDLNTGSCNAFYNGSSINFYADGGGCLTYANVADVVYHEYGHGINDNFYTDNGSFFINGAVGEGYADFWAMSYTINPILGVGGDDTDPNSFIRRYDTLKKVYPIDIVGEVHADGEIICGAWWDTYLNVGSDMNLTMGLYRDAYSGLQAVSPNGDEGTAYTNVLIDALQADDVPGNGGDNDITNGTPNGLAIVDAFALHGITLISNAELVHTDLQSATENQGINITADLSLNFPFTNYVNSVSLSYRVNNSTTWNTVPMTNTSGNTYDGVIPSQPVGTVVAYYLWADDINNQVSSVQPVGAERAVYPNLPYFILVGYTLVGEDDINDFNQDFGGWTVGLPTDNATTGDWIADIPVGSFGTAGDPSTIAQTDDDHTPGGDYCFVTGNASPGDGIGVNDVDGGVTSLISPTFDLTVHQNATFSYWRWYTNSPATGANPNADWWQVYISDDAGASWIPVESTTQGQTEWRRMAFRANDYITATNQVQLRFNVSDSIRPGQNLDGGSLVEGAIDDLKLWDDANFWSTDDEPALSDLSVFPNPSNRELNLSFSLSEAQEVRMTVYNASGKEVYNENLGKLSAGEHTKVLPKGSLAAGLYNVRLVAGERGMTRKVKVLK